MVNPPLAKYASLKSVMILFTIILGFNGYFIVNMKTSAGPPPLDLKFTHSPEVTYKTFNAMSSEQRKGYMIGELTTDIIYPIIYTLFLSFSLLLLFNGSRIIPIIPHGALIADVFENLSIFPLLKMYPKEIDWLAWVSSIFTTIKWLFVFISLLLLIAGLLRKFILLISSK